jgi:hypothetical protein
VAITRVGTNTRKSAVSRFIFVLLFKNTIDGRGLLLLTPWQGDYPGYGETHRPILSESIRLLDVLPVLETELPGLATKDFGPGHTDTKRKRPGLLSTGRIVVLGKGW